MSRISRTTATKAKLNEFAGAKLSEIAERKHSELTNLLAPADDHLQYALLAGRKNEQNLSGGTEAAGTLNLRSWEGTVNSNGKVTLSDSAGLQCLGRAAVNGLLVVEGGGNFGSGTVQLGTAPNTIGKLLLAASRVAFGEPLTATQIKLNRKEYGGLKEKQFWARLEAEKEVSIFGISTVGAQEGEAYILTNFGTQNIKLPSESGEETKEEFRFKLAQEVNLGPDESVLIAYDPKSKRWRVIGHIYTAGEGLELSGKAFKVKALGIVAGMLGAESVTAAKIATEAVEEGKLKAEAVAKAKLAKAVQEELLTIAKPSAGAAYTSGKEETETKPTFITLLLKCPAEAKLFTCLLVNGGVTMESAFVGSVVGIQKLPVTFFVEKGGKWKATMTNVTSTEIFRQVVNSV